MTQAIKMASDSNGFGVSSASFAFAILNDNKVYFWRGAAQIGHGFFPTTCACVPVRSCLTLFTENTIKRVWMLFEGAGKSGYICPYLFIIIIIDIGGVIICYYLIILLILW